MPTSVGKSRFMSRKILCSAELDRFFITLGTGEKASFHRLVNSIFEQNDMSTILSSNSSSSRFDLLLEQTWQERF